MATPEKKKPAASKGKKAATVEAEKEKSEEKSMDVDTEKEEKVKKTTESAETRKRPKAVKEVVAAKKPKSKLDHFFFVRLIFEHSLILSPCSRSSCPTPPETRDRRGIVDGTR